MRKRLAGMKPLSVPKKFLPSSPETEKADESKEDSPDIAELMKRATVLRNEINKTLVSPTIVDLRKKGSTEAMSVLVHQQAKHHKLKMEAEKLQLEVRKRSSPRPFIPKNLVGFIWGKSHPRKFRNVKKFGKTPII